MSKQALAPFFGKIVIFNVCGDAEAFVFDVEALDDAARAALVARHWAAFAAHQKKRGVDVLAEFVPFALVGLSMPPEARARLDLSADHEGILFFRKKNGAVFYVAGADDLYGYFVADSVDAVGLRPSAVDDAISATWTGPPTARTGFTLEQYAIGGNALAMTMGRFGGPLGVIERVWRTVRGQ